MVLGGGASEFLDCDLLFCAESVGGKRWLRLHADETRPCAEMHCRRHGSESRSPPNGKSSEHSTDEESSNPACDRAAPFSAVRAFAFSVSSTTVPAGPANTSSITIRASAISCSRCFASFFRQRWRRVRIGFGVFAGIRLQSGSALMISASISATLAAEYHLARQQLEQNASKSPDVGTAVGPDALLTARETCTQLYQGSAQPASLCLDDGQP